MKLNELKAYLRGFQEAKGNTPYSQAEIRKIIEMVEKLQPDIVEIFKQLDKVNSPFDTVKPWQTNLPQQITWSNTTPPALSVNEIICLDMKFNPSK